MPDVDGGLAFARGLLETALPYHEQLQQRDRDDEERQRTGMLSILSAAMHSDSLDPKAYPILLERALELQGAKGKDVKRYGDAFRSLLSGGYETTGTKITGYDTEPSTIRVGEGESQVSTPVNEPSPIADFNAKIHKPLFQSPEAVAQREADVAGQRESAVRRAREPFEIADDERTYKREQLKVQARADAARARATAQENLLIKRYGLKATGDIDALQNQIQAANPLLLPEEAREQAGQRLSAKFQANFDLLKAKVGLTNKTAEAVEKKLFYEGERVAQGWERVKQGWDSLDLREQGLALEEGYRQALVEMQGNTKRQQEYAAKAKPYLDQIRQTESQRASLERMMAGGLAVGDNVGTQVGAYSKAPRQPCATNWKR
jgi:hypothetical protein